MRKNEIDGLEWKHVNLAKGAITIEPTEYRDLKTAESAAKVEIDPVLAEELRKFKPAGEPTFVIESHLRPGRRQGGKGIRVSGQGNFGQCANCGYSQKRPSDS